MLHPDKGAVNPDISLQAQSHNRNHEKKGTELKVLRREVPISLLDESIVFILNSFYKIFFLLLKIVFLHNFDLRAEFGDNWMESSLRERRSSVILVSLTTQLGLCPAAVSRPRKMSCHHAPPGQEGELQEYTNQVM